MPDQINEVPEIRLHPQYGMNPHPSICPSCGGRDGTVVMLGSANNQFQCDRCHLIHVGDKRLVSGCPRCHASRRHVKFLRQLRPEEAVIGNTCADCQVKIDLADKIVAEGGIYWRCASCGSRGSIKASHPLAQKVRAEQGKPAPEPCGYEFNLNDCPVCGEVPKKQRAAAEAARKLAQELAREEAIEMPAPHVHCEGEDCPACATIEETKQMASTSVEQLWGELLERWTPKRPAPDKEEKLKFYLTRYPSAQQAWNQFLAKEIPMEELLAALREVE